MILIIILVVLILLGFIIYYNYTKEKFAGLNNLSSDETEDDISDTNLTSTTEQGFLSKYIRRSLIFIFLFILLSTNLMALAVSLQCNKQSNIFFKLASGLFAFMFGILYLIFNYYMYRVKVNNKPCIICRNDIFGLSAPQ